MVLQGDSNAEEHNILQMKHLPGTVRKKDTTQGATVIGTAAEQPGIPCECLCTSAGRRPSRGNYQHRQKMSSYDFHRQTCSRAMLDKTGPGQEIELTI